MGKAYVIFSETINDPQGIEAYMAAAMPTIGESGCRVLAFDDAADVVEGTWGGRTVILEFDSPELAKAWYDSDEYQAAKALRVAAADCDVAVVNGF